MKWQSGRDRWKRRFALLPLTVGAATVWLEWYWVRFAGTHYEVLFTDPASLTSQSAQADGAAQVPGDKSREAHK